MSRMYDWPSRLKIGQQGERIVTQLFLALIGKLPEFAEMEEQKRGIDFHVPGFEVEVKTETYSPERIFIEYEDEDGNPSGHAASVADVFIHVFINYDVVLCLNGEGLRKFIQERIGGYKSIRVYTRKRNGKGKGWYVIGAAVPLEDLQEFVDIVEVRLCPKNGGKQLSGE